MALNNTTLSQVDDDGVIEQIQSEKEDGDEGTTIYRVASYPSDWTLEGLHLKWQRKEISIPPLQRGWVWSHVQASRLIESFLLGLPVPAIFTYRERETEHQLVIDGQQRLLTVFGFFDGELPRELGPFSLKGVSSQWEGKRFAGLEQSDKIRLRDSVLRVTVIEQLDPQDDTSINHIFERLNTGGTGLTPQEIRNCTSSGSFNNLLGDLNENQSWREVFGTENPDPRMRDRELILRFWALLDIGASYAKPMKAFLNKYMARHKKDTELESRKIHFIDTVSRVRETLGGKPFHVRGRGINAAVFDSVMVAFSGAPLELPSNLKERFETLKVNSGYVAATTSATTDVEAVKSRISLASKILFE